MRVGWKTMGYLDNVLNTQALKEKLQSTHDYITDSIEEVQPDFWHPRITAIFEILKQICRRLELADFPSVDHIDILLDVNKELKKHKFPDGIENYHDINTEAIFKDQYLEKYFNKNK